MSSKYIQSSLILVCLAFTFLFSVYYNYTKARQAIKETKPSELYTVLESIPKSTKVGERTDISWQVVAPEDFKTSFTTIYYGDVSTPSAVTSVDSPAALDYQHYTTDYTKGNFFLPGTFQVSLVFPKPGKYYLRSYSFVRNNHLWSNEEVVEVLP